MSNKNSFIKNAILGKNVGAVSSSSRFVIRRVLKEIHAGDYKNIVEYGPGDGVLTRELLKLLPRKGRLLVVETDKNFLSSLNQIRDKRLTVVEGRMQDVSKDLKKYIKDVDVVVSSVPFSMIKKGEREDVVKYTWRSLNSGGKFVVFHQYSTIMSKYLEKYFGNVDEAFEPRNIFPCFVIVSVK